MNGFGLSVDIVESNAEISSEIVKALAPDVTKYFNTIFNELSDIIPDIIVQSIVSQPEYDSLMGGTLQYEFGIPDPASRLSEILNTIRNGAVLTKKPVISKSNSLSGGFKIQMIRKDFSDLLELGAASFTTEKGSQLNWLEWLLLEGDSVIISDNIFVFGPSKYSRTGFGIMRESLGGFWRVPPEYAGSINNNWITRAINDVSDTIEQEIQKLLKD